MATRQSPFVMANKAKSRPAPVAESKVVAPEAPPMFDNTFLKAYKISAFLKVYNYGVRPAKLRKEALYDLVEGLYDERFKAERDYVRKSMNKFAEAEDLRPPGQFPAWVYHHFRQRMGTNLNLVETRLVNLLFSVESYCNAWEQFSLFYLFLNEMYDAADLNCFLLLRSLIAEDLRQINKKLKPKKQLQLFSLPLTVGQCRKYLEEVFTDPAQVDPASLGHNLEAALKKNELGDKISAYDFLSFVVREYKAVREAKKSGQAYLNQTLTLGRPSGTDLLEQTAGGLPEGFVGAPQDFLQSEPTAELDPQLNAKLINPLISQEMRNLIHKFFEDVLSDEMTSAQHAQLFAEAQNVVLEKLEKLLRVFFEGNKVLWFKEMMIESPEERHMVYVEELFKEYRRFLRSPVRPNGEYREFCKRIFKTQELSDQITALITHILSDEVTGEQGSDDSGSDGQRPPPAREEEESGEDDPEIEQRRFNVTGGLSEKNVFKDSASDEGFY